MGGMDREVSKNNVEKIKKIIFMMMRILIKVLVHANSMNFQFSRSIIGESLLTLK